MKADGAGQGVVKPAFVVDESGLLQPATGHDQEALQDKSEPVAAPAVDVASIPPVQLHEDGTMGADATKAEDLPAPGPADSQNEVLGSVGSPVAPTLHDEPDDAKQAQHPAEDVEPQLKDVKKPQPLDSLQAPKPASPRTPSPEPSAGFKHVLPQGDAQKHVHGVAPQTGVSVKALPSPALTAVKEEVCTPEAPSLQSVMALAALNRLNTGELGGRAPSLGKRSPSGMPTGEPEACESGEEDEDEQAKRAAAVRSKKAAHARYMRFSRSIRSVSAA